MLKALSQVGFTVWFLIASCLGTLLYAGLFAARGGARRLRVLGAMTLGTTYVTIAAVAMGLATVGRGTARMLGTEGHNQTKAMSQLIVGMSEACAGGVMGFGTLALVLFITAFAFLRGVDIKS
jgi:hypothetical protein